MDFSKELVEVVGKLSQYYKNENEFVKNVMDGLLFRFYLMGLFILENRNEFLNCLVRACCDAMQLTQKSCVDHIMSIYKETIPVRLQEQLNEIDDMFQDGYFLDSYVKENGSDSCQICSSNASVQKAAFTMCHRDVDQKKDMHLSLCLHHFNHILSYLVINSQLQKEDFSIVLEWEKHQSAGNLTLEQLHQQLFEDTSNTRFYKNFKCALEFLVRAIKRSKDPKVLERFTQVFPDQK